LLITAVVKFENTTGVFVLVILTFLSEVLYLQVETSWAALSYWARRYDSAICCSNMAKYGHVAAAYSWIAPSCSV